MAALVAGASAAGPAYGMVGGADAAPVNTFVAKIDTADRACSGVLVHARWVLTVKTCFGTVPAVARPPAAPVTVTVGRTDLSTTAGVQVGVAELSAHPTLNAVLVKLASPVSGISPVAIGGAPVAGETLRAAGYGRTDTEWVPNRLRAAAVTVGAITDGGFAIAGSGGSGTTCQGDAGGPTLREVNGRSELVGVHDGSWQNGCLGSTQTQQGATEIRADKLGPWIQQHVRSAPSTEAITRNLARTATVTASSSAPPEWGWTPSQVNDGVRDRNGWSSWSQVEVNHTETLTLAFASERQVSRVDLYPRIDVPAAENNFPANFTIDVRNASGTWETVVSRTNYPKPATGQKFFFPARWATHMRIVGTNLKVLQLNEVEAYYSANLAADATVAASSSAQDWGWFLNEVNDGDRDQSGWSSWSQTETNHTEILEFSFPAAREVNRVDLYPRTDVPAAENNFPANFTIDVLNSANGRWETAVSKTNFPKPASGQRFSFPAKSASKFRIVGTGLKVMQFNEVEAYNSGNLAADATLTASSSAENWGWFLRQVNDGIRDFSGWSSWSQTTTNHTETLTLTFPAERQVNRVDLYHRIDVPVAESNFPANFTVDVMTSGGAWKQVVSKTNWPAADTPAQLAFPVESTRQIRITGTGLKVMQFNEVEAYHLFPSPAVAAPANPLPSIVESRDHPGAEQILAQHGIRLFKGDGHIVFVTSRRFVDGVQCDVGQIQVDVVTPALPGVWYCFRTVGTSGYLTLEVPGTFLVRAGNQQLQAKARVASGETQTFPIPPNTPVEIDPGDGSEFPQAVLLELRLA